MVGGHSCEVIVPSGLTKEERIMIEGNGPVTEQTPRAGAGAARIRLLMAEDHPIMRETLRSVLKQYPEIEIVGEATNGEEAVMRAKELQPAIVLMDINMPKLDGIAATQRIKETSSRIAVIGLSVDGERNSLNSMLRAGAFAVLLKERAADDLYGAIKRAVALSDNLPEPCTDHHTSISNPMMEWSCQR